jgi:hypothetical protein
MRSVENWLGHRPGKTARRRNAASFESSSAISPAIARAEIEFPCSRDRRPSGTNRRAQSPYNSPDLFK